MRWSKIHRLRKWTRAGHVRRKTTINRRPARERAIHIDRRMTPICSYSAPDGRAERTTKSGRPPRSWVRNGGAVTQANQVNDFRRLPPPSWHGSPPSPAFPRLPPPSQGQAPGQAPGQASTGPSAVQRVHLTIRPPGVPFSFPGSLVPDRMARTGACHDEGRRPCAVHPIALRGHAASLARSGRRV